MTFCPHRPGNTNKDSTSLSVPLSAGVVMPTATQYGEHQQRLPVLLLSRSQHSMYVYTSTSLKNVGDRPGKIYSSSYRPFGRRLAACTDTAAVRITVTGEQQSSSRSTDERTESAKKTTAARLGGVSVGAPRMDSEFVAPPRRNKYTCRGARKCHSGLDSPFQNTLFSYNCPLQV